MTAVEAWPLIDPWDQPVISLRRSNPGPIVPVSTKARPAVKTRGTPEPVALHNSALPGRWVLKASCSGLDPNRFFPRRGQDQTGVMEICEGCPVKVPCRDYSLSVGPLLQSIWGGQNERQRRRARTNGAGDQDDTRRAS